MPEYNIKVQFEQKTFSFLCSEDQDIISAAKMNGIDLPSSCCSGVCTDCASMILEGSVDQDDAMGLSLVANLCSSIRFINKLVVFLTFFLLPY